MDRMRIKIEGMDETLEMLGRAVRVHTRVDALRRDFAFGTLGTVMRVTPVATGRLKASNMVQVVGMAVDFVNYANYASFVELGTGQRGGQSYKSFPPLPDDRVAFALNWPGMAAQPFLRYGVARGLKELEKRVEALGPEVGGK